jgi:replicative DNA helicase
MTDVRQTGLGNASSANRQPPHNIDAEEAILGAAMLSSDALEVLATEVETDDFYRPQHRIIHACLRELWEAGIMRPDPVLVGDELAAKGQLEDVGGPAALMGIQAMTPTTNNASKYARIVVEAATCRRLARAGREIEDMAFDAPENVAEAVDQAKHMIAQVELPVNGGTPSASIDTFLAVEDSYNWMVPGLLERRDRIIITGGEGGGKSTLLRQLAVMLAAGIHPFRFHHTDPVRVLLVDVENSAAQIRRAIEPLVNVARKRDTWNPANLMIEVRGEGLDLTQRHDSRWLMERVAVNRPDVLITGPIYKLFTGNPNDEEPARKVAGVFDMLRNKYDVSVILEAHAAKASGGLARNLAPYGASLWLRWPEFGYGLRPDSDAGQIDGRSAAVYFEPWRGARDQREWPARLSGDGAQFWPWRDSAAPPVTDPSMPTPPRPAPLYEQASAWDTREPPPEDRW